VTIFVLIAAALVAIAAAVLVVPLAGRSRSAMPPARIAALVAVVLLAGGAAALYAWLGNRAWLQKAADSPQAMVGRLARRLEREPQDLNGWLMLGRSYAVLEEFPLAARAFERANSLAGGKNAEAITGLAEALVLEDQTQLSGRAGALFERALALDPRSPRALFYGAAVAEGRGDLKLARDRFQALLDQSPPERVRPILQRQIASLDARIAIGDGTPRAPASTPGLETKPVAGGGQSGAKVAPAGPVVRVHITLDAKVAPAAPSGAPTFVFIRLPDTPGPPLAARRIETRFPQTVELSQADAMIQGHGIEPDQDVEIIARISRSGTPQAHSGDLFGRARIRVGVVADANVDINQLSP